MLIIDEEFLMSQSFVCEPEQEAVFQEQSKQLIHHLYMQIVC